MPVRFYDEYNEDGEKSDKELLTEFKYNGPKICSNCYFYICLKPKSQRTIEADNSLCGAAERANNVDTAGKPLSDNERYRPCRDVYKNGDCKSFRAGMQVLFLE